MEQIVFICTGNTCRSPMAEGIFCAMDGQQRTGLQANSAGLFAHPGLPASDYAIKAAAQYHADLSTHRAKQLDAELVKQARYLVCMTAAHYDRLIEAFPQAEDKVFTLGQTDIDDPFGGGWEVYQTCAKQIAQQMSILISNLEKQA